MKKLGLCVALLTFSILAMAQTRNVNLRIVETGDIHGCFFPYNFMAKKDVGGSLARVSTYVNELRAQYGDNLLLFDNGDILQGQPTCYYYNYIKTDVPNVAADIMNYMKYDVENVGNHDIEPGHSVYDKWAGELNADVLCGNAVDSADNKPYFKPYTVFKRDDVRIAVLGLITPAIPNWQDKELWSGMWFDDMVASAKMWMAHIKEVEQPDVIIGLLHSGKEGGITTDKYSENEAFAVVRQVPGFDLVLYGHDHTAYAGAIKNVAGDDVLCLNPSCYGMSVSDAQISVTLKDGKVIDKKVSGNVVSVADKAIDEGYIRKFQPAIDSVKAYVNKNIGTMASTIYTRDCFFGSAPFTDFIHDLQLQITGADVSFNAPLSFNDSIKAGEITIEDMFNLYKYENQLYTLKMTGKEIHDYLEMSYALWTNTMASPEDHIMLLDDGAKDDKQRYGFKNETFNFDSAAGINYIVDVTKPNGNKVTILPPFYENRWYTVAMNSYRANGGGELLTRGAGIPQEELANRIVTKSERDQRYYFIQQIERAKNVNPQAHNNWKFLPEAWTEPAIKRDKALLFGK